jgi:hypothetical protein
MTPLLADFLDLFFRGGSPTALLIILLLVFAAIAIVNLVVTSKDAPIDLGFPHFVLGFVVALSASFFSAAFGLIGCR